MKRFVCIREDQVLLLQEEEITQHLLKGQMFDEIFEVGRAMELQIRLVASKTPKKNVSKTAPEADEVSESIDEEVSATNGVARKGRRKKTMEASA